MTSLASTLSHSDRLASSSARVVLFLLRARAILVLVLLLMLFSALAPAFLTANNLAILSKHVAISAILAIGMTFVILAGGIDLSVGSVAGLGGMVAGYVLTQGISIGGSAHYPPVFVAILCAVAVCLVVGALNGWLVSKAGVAPFIATLGTLYIARGAALLISNGKTFPNLAGQAARGNTGFTALGQSFLLHIPLPVWIMFALFCFAAVVAAKTPFGRHVYAVGGNERASRLAGIRVPRVKLMTYIFSSFCAAIVGLIIASQLEAAHPATGESFELNAIAAVVLGGTSLMGGRGSVTGSLIGAFVIGVLADGLVMLGVSEFWQIVIKGVVIVMAVAIDQLQSRLQAKFLPYMLRSDPQAGAR
jgi:erythritol transport system permease protein